jgi:dihydrofolate synthase/folylpolyglutamate synthase
LRAVNPHNPPSFFDVATAAALLLFFKAGVDYVILEAGLGGRSDATNIVQPVVTCITSIELEHTEKLGNTLAAIAQEKAGIIKAGIPVIVGNVPESAAREIAARANALQAPLIQLGKTLQVNTKPMGFAMDLQIRSGLLDIAATLPVLGQHQAQNSALAVACVQQLSDFPPATLIHATQRGLAHAKLPGRSEILGCNPWIVVDSAHTQASIHALSLALARIPARHIHFVISLSKDKNPETVCSPLLHKAAAIVVTQAEPTRSLSPHALAAVFRKHHPSLLLRIITDPIAAVTDAYRGLSPNTLLCITGSVYIAGIARSVLSGHHPPFAA